MPDVDGTPHHDPESDCSLYANSKRRPRYTDMKPKAAKSVKPPRKLSTKKYQGLKAKVEPSDGMGTPPDTGGSDAFSESVFAGSQPMVKGLRKIMDGSEQRNYDREIPLTISSKCPGKWAFIDMETGDIWVSGIRVGKELQKFYSADKSALHMILDAVFGQARIKIV